MANLDIIARVVDKTKGGVNSADANLGKLEKRTSKIGKVAGAAAIGVAGIAVAGIAIGAKLVGDFLNSADAIGKMSTATGVGIEKLQTLDFALQQNGSSIGTFEKGIQTFARSLTNAAIKGTGPVKEGLEELGIEIEDIIALSPDEQFKLLAEAISKVENPTLAAGLAQKLFGGAGRELLPTLKGGAEGLDKLTEEAIRNGNIMSTDTVRGAEAVNDAIASAKDALISAATNGFAALLPHIQTFVMWFSEKVVPVIINDVLPAVKSFIDILQATLIPIIQNTVIPAVQRIVALFGKGGGGDGDGLGQTIKVLEQVMSVALPIIAAVLELAITVMLSSLELLISTLLSLIEFISAVFRGDWQAAWDAVSDIFEAFIAHITTIFTALFEVIGVILEAFGIDTTALWEAVALTVETAIAAIVETLTLMTDTLDEVLEFISAVFSVSFTELWEAVALTVEMAIAAIVETLTLMTDTLDEVLEFISAVFNVSFTELWEAVALTVETAIAAVLESLTLMTSTLTTVITFVSVTFRGAWKAAWDAISRLLGQFAKSIKRIFNGAFVAIGKVLQSFGRDFVRLWKGIANSVIGVIESIPNAFIGAINAIIRAWNGFSLKLPGFHKRFTLPFGKTLTIGFAGVTLNTPDVRTLSKVSLPRLRDGGIVTRPTLVEAGEGGQPEAIVPLSRLGQFGGTGGTLNLRMVLELDGEKLGEYIVKKVNLASASGDLDLVTA